MSVRGPLVAECDGVSAEEREAFVAAWQNRGWANYLDVGGIVGRNRWKMWRFECCGIAEYWVPPQGERLHTRPQCPVCDPVGARNGDADAIAALACDVSRDRAMLEAVVAAGPERVAVLLDVSQDGQPLGRLQHPDDKAEIERLRAEVERLTSGLLAAHEHALSRHAAYAHEQRLRTIFAGRIE